MLRRYIFGFSLALFCLSACKTAKTTEETVGLEDTEEGIYFEVNGIEVYGEEMGEEEETLDYAVAPVYKGSATRIMDLEHTTLKIRFDWQKQEGHGQATLRLHAYAKPVDSFYIDAVAMEIHSVEIRENNKNTPCSYSYNGKQILVRLNKTHGPKDLFELTIRYTARPNEVMNEGSEAITDAKGLYFINPLGDEPNKPRQIWTQGETESTSAWLPTIDAPNEKMTHDLFITVNDTLQTIANGEFMMSSQEGNGLRTDHWKMEKPHAPYLVAMVIGQFHVVKDEWNDIPVNYYVDKQYAPSANRIFSNTPEMIEFFSNKLEYPYPWPKYDQVVVDDFVSGAMENTTITIHGDMLKLDTRELLDRDYEDVIAHELFHHWFGDLVTCEAWGQLPLNESFATYGEYLWREYKYGRDNADEHLFGYLQQYFVEAYGKKVKMIRDDYSTPEEMFDAHSYQKGGLILHMLRKYIGDEAFFSGLTLYLKKFQYGTTEIHNLRQAFEETSGEDLNWFFNQWFFKAGHPSLEVYHSYEEVGRFYTLEVNQIQDLAEFGAYRLPVEIRFQFGDSVYTELLDIRSSQESFFWEMPVKPDWVSFDAQNMLLAKVREVKTVDEWLAQLKYSKLFKDRQTAILHLDEEAESIELIEEACSIGLADPYYQIRNKSMELMRKLAPDRIAGFRPILVDIAENHPKSSTRAAAFNLFSYNPLTELDGAIQKGLNDSSYQVNAAALSLYYKINPEAASKIAVEWAHSSKSSIKYQALSVLAQSKENYASSFVDAWNSETGSKFYLVAIIGKYLKSNNDPAVAIELLDMVNGFEPESDNDYFTVLFIAQFNQQVEGKWKALDAQYEEELKENPSPETEQKLKNAQRVLEHILHLF